MLNSLYLRNIIKEGVEAALSGEEAYRAVAKTYYEHFLGELEEAKEAFYSVGSEFHNGKQRLLIDRGWKARGTDSTVYFQKPGGLFIFYGYSWGKNGWELSARAQIDYHLFKLYGNSRPNDPYRQFAILGKDYKSFEDSFVWACRNGGGLPGENVETKEEKYTRFAVYEYMGGRVRDEKCDEFQTLEEAKEAAYKWAQEDCIRGRNGKGGGSSAYYKSSPVDYSKYAKSKGWLAYYVFYEYDEHDYGYYVCGYGD